MLYSKFELIPTSIFRVTVIFKNEPKSEKFTVLYSSDFSKKWLRNHEKFLLHFLIHIDVLMLCSKFELIPTSIFRVTVIFKNEPKSLYYSTVIFPKNGSEITKIFYYIFLYILMYLCCIASLS